LGYIFNTFSFSKFIGLSINCFLSKGDRKMYSIKKSLQKKIFSAVVVALILFLSNITNALETPLSYDFGEVPIGSSSTAFISISTSTTEIPLNLWATLENGEHYKIKTSIPPLGIPLPPGETVEIEIVFTPTITQAVFDTLYIDVSNPNPLYGFSIREEIKLVGNETEISINDILTFFDASVASGSLIGNGGSEADGHLLAYAQKKEQNGDEGKSAENKLHTLRKMLVSAGKLIESEDLDGACRQLTSISKKCDGKDRPPDFVLGAAEPDPVPQLENMLGKLSISLECK
jgi:hypothetical protein